MSKANFDLANTIAGIPGGLDKIRLLAQAIRDRAPGTTEALIELWMTLPQELWEEANRSHILTQEEWTVCLMILRKFQEGVRDD